MFVPNRSFITVIFAIYVIFISQALGCLDTEVPKTPAEKRLLEFLAVVESGDAQKMKKFAEGFAKSFLEKFPVEDHVDFFMQAHERYGGFVVVKVKQTSDFEIETLLKCKNLEGEFRQFMLRTETSPPYAIIDMSYGMAEPPGEKRASLLKAPEPPIDQEARDPHAVVKGKLGKTIDRHMIQKVKEGFSGIVLVAKGGEKILHKGYGWAVRERKIPVTTQTVFDIGSISKPFTASVIMKLEQQGKLKTTDLITKFFKNVPEDKRDITIHHLLTHSAGLGEYHDTKGDFEKMTREEALDHIFTQRLKFKPGEKNAYSNSGFTLLAIIAEKVSGQTFKEYLKEQILEPAGMSGTGFYRNPSWKEENVAYGYNDRKLGKQNSPLTWPEITWALLGNGGMVSSAEDLYKFHFAMKGDRILSNKIKEKSYSLHVKESENVWMGYGWGIRKTSRNTKVVSHGGANDFGFRAYFVRYLDDDAVIIITSNCGRAGNIRDIYRKIDSLVFADK